jgi:hypothetical protein
MAALADGRSTVGQGPAGNVTVVVEGLVVDPVATGRELERILRKYAAATGSDVALQVGTRR